MEASSTISKFFNADTARWFDLLIEGIVILDEKQRFVYANQAYRNHVHMDDETYAKYQGKDWIAVRRAIRAQADSISNKVFSTGRPIYNYHQRLNDGTESYSDVVPYWDRGEIVGAIIVVRDILSLRDLIQTVQEKEKYISQLNERVKGFYKTRYAFEDIIGQDYPYIKLAKKAAQTDNSVFLIGESGTGKEVVAQSIHRDSYRGGQSFVDINCASLPETLLDSELFGYVPGAFTGASKNGKIGLFELANGGTLFLDEITEMPLPLQSKLRVLQERQIRRLGDTKNIKVDVRVIAATNQDMEKALAENRFRQDLFYRLAVIAIQLPPLRERKKDFDHYVSYFLQPLERQYKKRFRFSKEADQLMHSYKWPGNIRELENVIERCCILTSNGTLTKEALPSNMQHVLENQNQIQSENDMKTTAASSASPVVSGNLPLTDIPAENMSSVQDTFVSPTESVMNTDHITSAITAEESEKLLIIEHLKQSGGNVKKASDSLGISRRTLYRKLEKYEIDPAEIRYLTHR